MRTQGTFEADTPLASTARWRLLPSLPRSVGSGPVSWPTGAGHVCPIDTQPAPVDLVVLT